MSWSVAPYAAVLRGALDEAEAGLGRADVGPWALAAAAAGAVLDPLRFAPPTLDSLGAWAFDRHDAEAREAIGCACAHLGRAALLGFDAPALERVLALHTEVVRDLDPGSEASLWRVLADGWRAWLRGAPMPHDASLEAIETRARALGSAAIVIDACALRALGAESRGDAAGMLAMARRASRMARTEGLPAQEHLAHVVLARARRWARHPHLAIRILGALDRFVEGPCRAWVRWERLLSGDGDAIEGEKPDASAPPAVRASAALASAIRAAMAGNPTALDAAASQLAAASRGVVPLAHEGTQVVVALDPRRAAPAGDAALEAWCAGRTDVAPPSLHGLCVRIDDDAQDASEAVVLAGPGAPPRRILGLGAGLAHDEGRVRLKRTSRRRGRIETLVATLVCAGEDGTADAVCYEQVYETAYEPDRDRGVFEVLVTRARLYAEGIGEITRGGGRVAIRLRATLLVPDPRCAAPLHDRILRVLAREGRVTASDAAERVGLSLRAVQQALRSLAEDGVCIGEKDGRQISYAVEDTTFSEPTQMLALRRAALRGEV